MFTSTTANSSSQALHPGTLCSHWGIFPSFAANSQEFEKNSFTINISAHFSNFFGKKQTKSKQISNLEVRFYPVDPSTLSFKKITIDSNYHPLTVDSSFTETMINPVPLGSNYHPLIFHSNINDITSDLIESNYSSLILDSDITENSTDTNQFNINFDDEQVSINSNSSLSQFRVAPGAIPETYTVSTLDIEYAVKRSCKKAFSLRAIHSGKNIRKSLRTSFSYPFRKSFHNPFKKLFKKKKLNQEIIDPVDAIQQPIQPKESNQYDRSQRIYSSNELRFSFNVVENEMARMRYLLFYTDVLECSTILNYDECPVYKKPTPTVRYSKEYPQAKVPDCTFPRHDDSFITFEDNIIRSASLKSEFQESVKKDLELLFEPAEEEEEVLAKSSGSSISFDSTIDEWNRHSLNIPHGINCTTTNTNKDDSNSQVLVPPLTSSESESESNLDSEFEFTVKPIKMSPLSNYSADNNKKEFESPLKKPYHSFRSSRCQPPLESKLSPPQFHARMPTNEEFQNHIRASRLTYEPKLVVKKFPVLRSIEESPLYRPKLPGSSESESSLVSFGSLTSPSHAFEPFNKSITSRIEAEFEKSIEQSIEPISAAIPVPISVPRRTIDPRKIPSFKLLEKFIPHLVTIKEEEEEEDATNIQDFPLPISSRDYKTRELNCEAESTSPKINTEPKEILIPVFTAPVTLKYKKRYELKQSAKDSSKSWATFISKAFN